jgi:hypothetical protein
MADTAQLLRLIDKYSEAFADTEIAPPVTTPPELTEPDEEGRTGETEQSDCDQYYNDCRLSLCQLEDDPKLLAIAADFLEKLTDIAAMNNAASSKKYWDKSGGLPPRPLSHVVDEVSAPILVDLPETHARQGMEGCPSGMCGLD